MTNTRTASTNTGTPVGVGQLPDTRALTPFKRVRAGVSSLASRPVVFLGLVVIVGITIERMGEHRREQAAGRRIMVRAVAAADDERRVRDLDIAFYRERARADPTSADDRSRLAQLYLARGRATGDPEDALRAEAEARSALAIRSSHNSSALLLLASALLEQHRFAPALDAALALVEREPDDESHRALLAEIFLELGRYNEARATFATILKSRGSLTVAPRLARLAEIEGRNDAARAILKAARDEAMRRPGMPREQLAWFHVRLADSEMRAGRYRGAEMSLLAALTIHPDDHRALAALAALANARGEWRQAIDFGERAIASVPDAATLGLLADAYHALDDSAQAEDFAQAAEIAALGTPGPMHRSWSLFLLDHNRRTAEVHARAEEDLRSRHDVYGFDVLAWSLHVQGRDSAARVAMHTALGQGTRDAVMLYHAAMIEQSLGDSSAARAFMEQSVAVNPRFAPARAASSRPRGVWLVGMGPGSRWHL